MGLVWLGVVGFFLFEGGVLAEFVGLNVLWIVDLGFFGNVSISPSKKISANGCGFIEKCSVQLLP